MDEDPSTSHIRQMADGEPARTDLEVPRSGDAQTGPTGTTPNSTPAEPPTFAGSRPSTSPASAPWVLVGTFSVAIFLNAALLFAVQPMFTKMVLPLLGGSPSVWNTCLLFFQSAL